MKKIITNKNNLKEEDMTELVQRVKVLLINSKNELLLGYSHNDYQFPGGHVDDGETLMETVKREVLEETGIILDIDEMEPFACTIGYYKDWPEKEKNRKIEIYYYEIKTEEQPNLEDTKYTEHEIDGNFELKYINLNDVEQVLFTNADKFGDKHGITREMIELLKIYKDGSK